MQISSDNQLAGLVSCGGTEAQLVGADIDSNSTLYNISN